MTLRLRGGLDVPGVPPSGDNYGPRPNRQAIIDGAVPRARTKTGILAGATDVPVGSFTQATLNAAGVGGKLWLLAGTHTVTSPLAPLNNQIIGCAPGAIIDGANTGTNLISVAASGVQILGGKWQRAGNPAAVADWWSAILFGGGPTYTGCVVEDAEICDNANRGLHFQSNGFTARRVYAHDNQWYGISAAKNAVPDSEVDRFTGTVVEYCHLARNGVGTQIWQDEDPGQKFTYINEMSCRYNYVHNQRGPGLWWDWGHKYLTISDNVIENNSWAGIFYEASLGGSVIEYNHLQGNGSTSNINYPYNGGQIDITNSPCDGTWYVNAPNVSSQVNNNRLISTGVNTPIKVWNHSGGDNRCRKWYVHHNEMWMYGPGGEGVGVGLGDYSWVPKLGEIGTSPGAPAYNLFDFNQYHVADTGAAYWRHETAYGSPGPLTWVQFRSRGHEANSSSPVVI